MKYLGEQSFTSFCSLVKAELAKYFRKPSGGTTGQVLTKTSTGEAWANVPSELPAVTTSDNGKILTVSGGKWTAATLPKYTGGVS